MRGEEQKNTDGTESDRGSSVNLDRTNPAYPLAWDREKSRDRLDDDRKQCPLTDIEIEDADVLIDLDVLSGRKNKRVTAVSLFADLSGFTAYIDAAEDADKQKEALRVLHAVRKEFTKVLTDDYNGVRIQYQGDRTQAIFHLPKDDSEAIATKAVRAAAGLQSSMEKTLKDLLPEAKSLSVAVGVDIGLTLVSQLATRGARDPICLGEPVETAARIEEQIKGQETGISSGVHGLLSEDYRELFEWRKDAHCYVASGLTADKLELVDEAANLYKGNTSVFVKTVAGVTTVTNPHYS